MPRTLANSADEDCRDSVRTPLEQIRRSELVDAAIRTIAMKGFGRTTVRDIAQAAGTATGSIHYYFKTKDELLHAAYVEAERRFQARLHEVLHGLAGLPKLRRVVEVCFDDHALWSIELDLWQHASRDATFRRIFGDASKPWVAMIASALEEAIAAGELSNRLEVDLVALELAALIDGLGIYTLVTNHLTTDGARDLAMRRLDALEKV